LGADTAEQGPFFGRTGAMADPAQVKALEVFVAKFKEDPAIIHSSELAFFKDFLVSLRATLPAEKPPTSPSPCRQPRHPPHPAAEEESKNKFEEPEEEDTERLPKDAEPFPEKAPLGELELTDEQLDEQADAQRVAAEAVGYGNFETALSKYTEAIRIGSVAANLYAKRAEVLLKLKRPCACISDCDAALAVNPNNARAYRVRGRANRLIGNWERAHADLGQAQSLDFDSFGDADVELRKLVAAKWENIQVKQRDARLKAEEHKDRKRHSEATRIYEEQKKAEAAVGGRAGGSLGGRPGGFPGGGIPRRQHSGIDHGMLQDPDVLAAICNPKVVTAIRDMMKNPDCMGKYQSDPEVMALVEKLMCSGLWNEPGLMASAFSQPSDAAAYADALEHTIHGRR